MIARNLEPPRCLDRLVTPVETRGHELGPEAEARGPVSGLGDTGHRTENDLDARNIRLLETLEEIFLGGNS